MSLPDRSEDSSAKEMDENPFSGAQHPPTDCSVLTDVEDSGENLTSDQETDCPDDVELPSNVTDRKQIFMPLDLKRDDPRIYGKWLWFSNGDIFLQDQMWIQLSTLILQGLVILQESSTVKNCRDRGRYQGVIKCYTKGDVKTIRRAGLAIQKIVGDGVILHYKSNRASDDSLNRSYGDRFISEYMLTARGGLYAKDELDRWKKVKDVVEGKTSDCVRSSPHGRSLPIGLSPMPSQEFTKPRYTYPAYDSVKEFDGCWCLFCDLDRELDSLWAEAKRLVDEGVLSLTSCETGAYFSSSSSNPLRRSVSCFVDGYGDVGRLLQSGDRLRQETEYSFPMYFKVCRRDRRGKNVFLLKYLYSEDRELYEYVDESWQLKWTPVE